MKHGEQISRNPNKTLQMPQSRTSMGEHYDHLIQLFIKQHHLFRYTTIIYIIFDEFICLLHLLVRLGSNDRGTRNKSPESLRSLWLRGGIEFVNFSGKRGSLIVKETSPSWKILTASTATSALTKWRVGDGQLAENYTFISASECP